MPREITRRGKLAWPRGHSPNLPPGGTPAGHGAKTSMIDARMA